MQKTEWSQRKILRKPSSKGGFPVMAETTRKLAASTR